jgi:hypothetical protein
MVRKDEGEKARVLAKVTTPASHAVYRLLLA